MTGKNAGWAEGMEWTMRYLNKYGLKKAQALRAELNMRTMLSSKERWEIKLIVKQT